MKSFLELIETAGNIKSLASESGKSIQKVEEYWKEAIISTHKSHPKLTDKDNQFWAIVTGTVKKRLDI